MKHLNYNSYDTLAFLDQNVSFFYRKAKMGLFEGIEFFDKNKSDPKKATICYFV